MKTRVTINKSFSLLLAGIIFCQVFVLDGFAQDETFSLVYKSLITGEQNAGSTWSLENDPDVGYSLLSSDEADSFLFPQESGSELGKASFSINLGGLLFFGPTFRFEFRVGSAAVVDAHLRWAFAGVLYQGLVTDFWYEDATVLPYSIGVGTGFKALLGSSGGRHRFYVGTVIEYNYGGSTSDSGREERNHAVVFGGDIGMRWRSEGSFMFSLGIQPAVALVVKDGYFYEDYPDEWYDYGFSVRPAPILELSIGWEFGK